MKNAGGRKPNALTEEHTKEFWEIVDAELGQLGVKLGNLAAGTPNMPEISVRRHKRVRYKNRITAELAHEIADRLQSCDAYIKQSIYRNLPSGISRLREMLREYPISWTEGSSGFPTAVLFPTSSYFLAEELAEHVVRAVPGIASSSRKDLERCLRRHLKQYELAGDSDEELFLDAVLRRRYGDRYHERFTSPENAASWRRSFEKFNREEDHHRALTGFGTVVTIAEALQIMALRGTPLKIPDQNPDQLESNVGVHGGIEHTP